MSMDAGLHVPVIPLSELAGSGGAVLAWQMVILVPKLKVGVNIGLTVTLKLVVVAHCPAVGVKVYVPEAVLLTDAGLHVPV